MYVRMKYKNFTILHVAIQGARVDEECPIVRGEGTEKDAYFWKNE